jgi:parallel beta-helix repeat protein
MQGEQTMKTSHKWMIGMGVLLMLATMQAAYALLATGGNLTTNIDGYRIHIFTNSATASNFVVETGGKVEVLVVAGGGGGGNALAGGGGGGGLVYSNGYTVNAGTTTVAVGGGGAGGATAADRGGSNGTNSTFGSLIAYGGGGGGGYGYPGGVAAKGGGSGGGGVTSSSFPAYTNGAAGTNGQGNAGGNAAIWAGPNYPGGGGGGAGGVGSNAGGQTNGGAGGIGASFLQFGALAGDTNYPGEGWFAGGGGGGTFQGGTAGNGGKGGGGRAGAGGTDSPGAAGQPATGGGGGSGSYQNAYGGGGNGGSGIVMVRYRPAEPGQPEISNTGSQNKTDTSADIEGRLVTNGVSAATVYLYWSTNDCTTNATAWTTGGNVTNLGSYADDTLFTNTLSGLASNTTYYWNHSAVNASGTVWGTTAGSPSFKTLGPPAVNNGAGATGLTPFGATLNGALTDGTTAHVFVLLGTQDGVWTVTNDLGTLGESAFSNTVSGLTPGMTNYYTCYATNAYGSALATPSAMFTTPGSSCYVATNGASPWDGSSWATAFTNIQEALNVASNGGNIYLAAHTFRCPGQVNWNNSSHVSIQGGYTGDGGPGTLANTPTVITLAGGAMRIMLISGVTNASLVRVTITGGFTNQFGGGLCISNAVGLTLSSCTVSSNRAYLNGGGIWIGNSTNVTLASCVIVSNTQQDVGSDWVSRYGGGLFVTDSYGIISNCSVRANRAQPSGNNSIYGGGLSLRGGGWSLIDCVFAYNVATALATAQGGALHINGGTHILRNALVVGNDGITGDGIQLENGALTVLNSTLYGNVGEGVRRAAGTLSLSNSILWRNVSADVVGTATLGYIDSERGLSNGVNGCFASDPLFENGFYLAASSPCVNTGSTSSVAAGMNGATTRSDGSLDTDVVDLGYHYPTGITTIPDLYVAETGTNANNGLSWATALRSITAALSAATVGTRIHVGAGSYTNGLETFPLSMTKHGLQLLGTNSATTVVNASNSNQRVLNVTEMSGGRIEGLTFKGGKSTGAGGGINASLAGDLVIASCVIASNRSSTTGGGIYLQSSPHVLITNSIVRANEARSAGDWITVLGGGLHTLDCGGTIVQSDVIGNTCVYNGHDAAYGGGLALFGGGWLLDRCVVVSNRASAYSGSGNGWMTSRGGGLYVGSGTHVVRSSLLASNDCTSGYDGIFGDGVGVANGTVVIESSTVANNGGEGLRWFAGTVALTNSILWANGDDATGTITLAYCDIEDGDSVNANGCISNNPFFANGYRLPLGSPCINMGTNQAWMQTALDLDGNARLYQRADMGAYETYIPLSVSNRPATEVTTSSATLNGSVLSTGRAPAHVWVYWGPTDGGTNRTQWANSNYFGVRVVGELSTNVALTPPSGSYAYRFCATNEDGEAWADPAATFSLQQVWVTTQDSSADELGPDSGTFLISRTSTATNDAVVVAISLAGSATEGTDYVAIGGTATLPAGSSNVTVTVTPLPDRTREPGGETVQLTIGAGPYSIGTASNASLTITDWAPPAQIYVGGAGVSTYGTNWATAYTNLQQALNMAVSNDTLYLLAQTFTMPTQLLWTTSHITLQGGYAGDGAPGGPAGAPSVLTRAAGVDMRVLLMAGVTNASLSGVTLTGGNTTQRGGGLCISNSAGILLSACTLSNNAARLNGGGVYIVGSTNIAFVSCRIVSNAQQDAGSDWVYRYGGGVYAENSYGILTNTTVSYNVASAVANNYMSGGGLSLINGGWSVVDCVLTFNRATASAIAQGGALHINGGTHTLRNALVVGNEGITGDGIHLESGTLAVLHSTLYGNVGEGVRRSAGTLSISNSILWRNMSADVVGAAALGFLDTETGLSNGVNGCFSSDPLFENGFYLAAGSPCVNTGSLTATAAGLDTLTTRTDGAPDTNSVDLGYHQPAGITIIADLYVAETGTNTNDGLSWATAFRTITKALSTATAGTRVHVGAGTYTSAWETFPLSMAKHGLQLLGTNSATTTINASGSNQRVLSVSEVMTGGRIEGITLAGGNTAGSGGGLNILLASDLTLVSCVITNNRAGVDGGGLCVQDSARVTFIDCTLAGNVLAVSADWGIGRGGGLHAYNSRGVLSNCVTRGNHAYNAGMHATSRGAGLSLAGGYWTVQESMAISNRTASSTVSYAGKDARGSGLYVSSGTQTLRNVLFARNDCYQGFGGTFGDGINVDSGAIVLQNCTLVDNSGEGIRQFGGTVTATNCILWANGDDVAGTVTLAYSDIEDGDSSGANGNLSVDPLFENAAAGNYRLKPTSLCVNAGTNQTWMQNALDLDGKRRVALLVVDMGAYEVQTSVGSVFRFR